MRRSDSSSAVLATSVALGVEYLPPGSKFAPAATLPGVVTAGLARVSAAPHAVSFWRELRRSPRFLGSPCARALLSDPGEALGPDHPARGFRRRFTDSDGPHVLL